MTESGIAAKLQQPSVRLIGVVGLLLALLILLFAYKLHEEHKDRLTTAQMDIARLSRVLEEHTSRTVQAADLALVGASETYQSMPPGWQQDREVVGNTLKARLGNTPQIRAFLIVDGAGRNVGDTSGLSPPPSLADREYFAVLRGNPGIDVHVSRPARSVTTGKWFIAISRTLRAPDGGFDGVAVAFVEPSYFADFYGVVVAGSGNSIALVTDEGYLLARAPAIESLIGGRMSRRYIGRDTLAREPTGTHRAISSADGVDRIVSYRKVAGLPLVVIVGFDVREVLASWYDNAVAYVIVIVLVSLVVGWLAVVLFRQIRRGERSEAVARESEQLLRAALDAVPTSIAIRDASSRYVLVNRAVRERFGLAPGQVEGLSPKDVFPPEVVEWVEDQDRHIYDTGAAIPLQERARVYPDGVARTVLRGKSPVFAGPDPAQVTHVVTMTVDITERKVLERQLAQAKHAAELANRSKSEFLANMSHELRTPLNAMIGFSEIIDRRLFGPIESSRYDEYLRDIYTSAKHLLGIINDILDLSRIETGQMELAETLIDVADLIRSSLQFVAERANKAGIGLSRDAAPDLPALRGDQRKMKQVLINLLTNAVKFTAQGGQIVVSARLGADERLVLTVADTGIGISREDLPRVLQPFQQVSGAMNRSYEGTGLGLSITKSLVELHGGELTMESELGKGTTVTIALPAARSVKVSSAVAS